jgi:hypothetical protein
MQQVTSGILFYLLKVIFNLEGSVDQDISCIVKMKKKPIFFETNSNEINMFSFSSITRLKQDATGYI